MNLVSVKHKFLFNRQKGHDGELRRMQVGHNEGLSGDAGLLETATRLHDAQFGGHASV